MELSEYFNSLLKEKNISIEFLSQELKIPKKFLLNLQNNEIDKFPESVYVIGYLKKIAIFFKINEEELIDIYKEISPKEGNNTEFKYEPILSLEQKGSFFQIFLVLIVFVGIILGILYFFLNKQDKTMNLADNFSQKKQDLQSLKKRDNFSHKFYKKDNSSKVIDNFTDNSSKIIDNFTDNSSKVIDNFTDNKSKTTVDNISDNFSSSKKDNLSTLTLVGTDIVWIRINSDNKTVRDITLKKDEKYTISAKKFFKLKIGNAAGIKIFINNSEFPFKGKKGEVKNLFINLDNFSSNSIQ